MPKFPSAHAAFCWSYEILDVWRAGKGFDPDPDHLGAGGTGALGAVLVALQIEFLAQEACANNKHRCRRIHRLCLADWFLPSPIDPPEPPTREQEERIRGCAAKFEELLRGIGWVE